MEDCIFAALFAETICKVERDVAQVVEYTSGGRVVAGSSPVIPTS